VACDLRHSVGLATGGVGYQCGHGAATPVHGGVALAWGDGRRARACGHGRWLWCMAAWLRRATA
jgi:hypothetical protein